MKKIIFLVAVLFFCKNVFTQNNWVEIQTGFTTIDFNDVCFVNSHDGWLVGSSGTILRTYNAGHTWINQSSPLATSSLNGVCFTDTLHGWVVGTGGKILATSNGGQNWVAQNSGTNNELKSVFFINDTTGWAVGLGAVGTIIKTTNGGATWVTQSAIPITQALYKVFFINNQIGWAVGNYAQLIKTTNGGNTWNQIGSTTPSITNHSIYFTDSLRGWICRSDGLIKRTLDGGNNWSDQFSQTKPLYSVFFIDSLKGWCCGQDGVLFHTTNGGNNWLSVNSGVNTYLKSINFPNEKAGWIAGSNSTLLKNYELQKICFVTVDTLFHKNKIVWERLWDMGTAFYKIYKFIPGSNFQALDTVYFHELSEYVDITSTPHNNSDYYALTSVDSFGIESPRCPHHRTMFLQVSQGVPATTINLNWNAYVDSTGEFIPEYYKVMYGLDPQNMDSLTSVLAPGYSHTGVSSNYYYEVRVKLLNSCISMGESKEMGGPYAESQSNIEEKMDDAVNEIENSSIFKIYPNPAFDLINIEYQIEKKSNVQIVILNALGEKIANFENEKIVPGKHHLKIDLKTLQLSNGVYYFMFGTNDVTQYRSVFIYNR